MRNRLGFKLAGVVSGLLVTGALTVPTAQAAPRCTQARVDSGQCLPVVQADGLDPLVAGVSQARLSGHAAGAKKFVDAAASKLDAVRVKKMQEALTAKDARQLAGPQSPAGIEPYETVIAGTHYYEVHPWYFYCETDGSCERVGQFKVEMRTTAFFYPTVTLSGDMNVEEGPNITVNEFHCGTFEDISFLPDPEVKRWSNCDNATLTSITPLGKAVYEENWEFSGPNDYEHYNEYSMTFQPQVAGAPELSWYAQMMMRFYHTEGDSYFTWA